MRKKPAAAAATLFAAIFALSGCSLFGSAQTSAVKDYDFSRMKLVQLEKPAEGQQMAVIETTEGTIKAVLYPEYAPNTVDNFVNRANDGFYNGKDIFAIVDETLFLTGSYNDEGTQGLTNDGKPIANEYSVDLWTFRGALCSYSGTPGCGDSRFFIINNRELTEEDISGLRGSKNDSGEQAFPEELITAYTERGGFAHIMGYYTVFGQTVEGIDVIERICSAERNEETGRPSGEMKINSVKITEYHSEEEIK